MLVFNSFVLTFFLVCLSLMTRVEASSAESRVEKRAVSTPTSWHKYIRAPSNNTVLPVGIVANETLGNVTNPEALLASGGALTILSRETNSSDIPTVVVDFGQNVVGFLEIKFAGATSNSPGIRLAFSETIEYLSNISDFSRSDNVRIRYRNFLLISVADIYLRETLLLQVVIRLVEHVLAVDPSQLEFLASY